jgi:hypothetical protein
MSDKFDKSSYIGISKNKDAEGQAMPLKPVPNEIKLKKPAEKKKGKK